MNLVIPCATYMRFYVMVWGLNVIVYVVKDMIESILWQLLKVHMYIFFSVEKNISKLATLLSKF